MIDCENFRFATPVMNEKGKRGQPRRHHFLPHIFSIGINAEDGSRGAALVAGGGIGIQVTDASYIELK